MSRPRRAHRGGAARRGGGDRLARLLVVLATAVLAVPLAGPAGAAPAGPDAPAAAPTRIVVRSRDGADAAGVARAAAAGAPAALAAALPATAVVEVPADAVDGTLAALRARPDVAWAERDVVVRAARRVPDDPCWRGCPDDGPAAPFEVVGAPDAWEVTTGDPALRVAVLDTAVDVAHPDLAGKVDVGPSFSSWPGGCGDAERAAYAGHGTAVAGIVGAATGNQRGVAGLGWSTRVLAVEVLNGCGEGWASDVAAALRWAVDEGAPVVNLSMASGDSAVLREAVEVAVARGVVVVAAAGNAGTTAPQYPAAYDGVVAVGALDAAGGLAGFSGRGPWVDLVAPGVGVPALAPGDRYVRVSGTSFSAPMASATAALLLAASPGLPAGAVVGRLAGAAGHFDPELAAWGRLHAGAALTRPAAALWLVAEDGTFVPAGDAPPVAPVGVAPVAAAAAPRGLWVAAGDGAVAATGGAPHLGSMAGVPLARPVVGMAATPSGAGYWLVAADGGVFTFGDAAFHGSTGGMDLNQPVVGMASAPSGAGYWLVAADGGVFAFGDAAFHGSAGGIPLQRAVVGLAPSPAGGGYWLVAGDGGVFGFGAPFHGSGADRPAAAPVVGMVPTGSGGGYWLGAADGALSAFGDAGALRSPAPGRRVTALAAMP